MINACLHVHAPCVTDIHLIILQRGSYFLILSIRMHLIGCINILNYDITQIGKQLLVCSVKDDNRLFL